MRCALALALTSSPPRRLQPGRRQPGRRRVGTDADGGGRRHRRPGHPRARSHLPEEGWSAASRRSPATTSRSAPPATPATLTTKLVLTADNPTGDVAFGVDNTFASRALDEGVFAETRRRRCRRVRSSTPSTATAPTGWSRSTTATSASTSTTTWFADHDLEPPATLEDLTDPAYERPVRHRVRALQLARAGVPAQHRSRSTATTGPTTGSGCSTTTTLVVDGWERRLLRRVHPGRRGRHPADRAVLRLLAGVHRPEGRGRVHHQRAARHLLPARSSTPASWPAPTTPRVARRCSTSCCPTRCRPRCPRACTSSRSSTASSCPPTGRGTPSSRRRRTRWTRPRSPTNRDAWLEEWRDLVTQ